MLSPVLGGLVLLVVLLVLSALTSAAETSFFALSELELERLREAGKGASERVVRLRSRPRHLLVAILTANTAINVAVAVVTTLTSVRVASSFGLSRNVAAAVAGVLITLAILVFAEIAPKLLAVRSPSQRAQQLSLFVLGLFFLLYPVTLVLNAFATAVARLSGTRPEGLALSQDELKVMVEVADQQGYLEEEEREMIHSIFEFGETQVREIMVPRVDMVCAETGASIEELVGLITKHGHTRIPIYERSVDNIRGIIHAKDLLPYLNQPGARPSLESLARPVIFVPDSKPINEMLREFQTQRTHMAIVVDEYGGTVGLVTLEDVIEEIVGEIQDEYDEEPALVRPTGEHTWLVDAKISIEELNEALGLTLPTEEGYDTLGGFLLHRMGHLPQQKEEVREGDITFVIERVVKRRIKRVRVMKRTSQAS
ncbi:MAG: hemolysin family protein [candidate division KSB1 bacterium]|nr:hemolysin family protein [candidate division KSB1 bacterium]MDZ7391987.1 hemolysin family protein [candidate division KSB1 bacterium]